MRIDIVRIGYDVATTGIARLQQAFPTTSYETTAGLAIAPRPPRTLFVNKEIWFSRSNLPREEP